MSGNRHVEKARSAAAQVEHHRAQMAHWAGVRVRNIHRARVVDGMSVRDIAAELRVSESAVRKALTLAEDPDGGRARWEGPAARDEP